MKDFADDNLKFEEIGRKLFKPVENTVGKGEIARYEQFLLFPQCFLKACFPGGPQKVSLCGNGLRLKSDWVSVDCFSIAERGRLHVFLSPIEVGFINVALKKFR